MRLRYFHLRNYPPLENIEVVFSADSPLDSNNAIHFVVGVNGSGKTHLLQALTETFICLEQQREPHFPVTLAYELGKPDKCRTLVFDHSDNNRQAPGWWQSDNDFLLPKKANNSYFQNLLSSLRKAPSSNWDALIQNGGWPGTGVGLPKAVLAYTTGITSPWRDLFIPGLPNETSLNLDELEENTPDERPDNWSIEKEIQNPESDFSGQDLDMLLPEKRESQTEVCQFITPFMLKLAVLAITLPLALEEQKKHHTDKQKKVFFNSIREQNEADGLRGLLSKVDWVWPVSFSFSFELNTENLRKQQIFWMRQMLELATSVLQEPEPSKTRKAIFDLGAIDTLELKELIDLDKTPLAVFQRLVYLHQQGLIDELSIAIQKTDTDDILIFDELSDGEQMYLGRMALFHLLEKQDDALLLLDEPETHFNDRWKRDMVDIINQVLGEDASHVLISTHSGITLTDVFTDEIIVLEKDEQGHSQHKSLDNIHTFGATPDHPLRDVFGAPGTVGKRASAFLDVLLLCEPNREIVEALWLLDDDNEKKDDLQNRLIKAIQAEYKDKYDDARISSILNILGTIAQQKVPKPLVASVMKYFADSVGPGYYQFDLYRAVFRLTEGNQESAS